MAGTHTFGDVDHAFHQARERGHRAERGAAYPKRDVYPPRHIAGDHVRAWPVPLSDEVQLRKWPAPARLAFMVLGSILLWVGIAFLLGLIV